MCKKQNGSSITLMDKESKTKKNQNGPYIVTGDMTSVTKVRENLVDILGEVRYAHKRIRLTSNGKGVGAIIPLEDLEPLEAIEDKIDIELAEKVSKDGKTCSFDEILQEMGITREELTKPESKTKRKPRMEKQPA